MLLSEKNHKIEILEDIHMHVHSRVPYSFLDDNIKTQIFITFLTEIFLMELFPFSTWPKI